VKVRVEEENIPIKDSALLILLIEDDPDDAFLTQKLIEKCGRSGLHFHTVLATSMSDALHLLKKSRYQLILLDLSLPDSHGIETFEKIHLAAGSIPIVICSGLSDKQRAIDTIAKGAQDYIVKGQIELDNFERVIRYALERRKLQQLRDDFVNMVIHELRSPLTVSTGVISQMLDGIFGQMPAEQKEFLSIALKSMKRLHSLIDDLLDMAKIDLGKIELRKEEFDFAEVIRETAKGFRLLTQKKNIELDLKLPKETMLMQADKEKIVQVLMNLISNAVKFTNAGRISIEAQSDNGRIQCRVKDSGIGISEVDLKGIFEKFKTFKKNAINQAKGTGLGLAITKGIITAHGGELSVESKPGEGTAFTFEIPTVS